MQRRPRPASGHPRSPPSWGSPPARPTSPPLLAGAQQHQQWQQQQSPLLSPPQQHHQHHQQQQQAQWHVKRVGGGYAYFQPADAALAADAGTPHAAAAAGRAGAPNLTGASPSEADLDVVREIILVAEERARRAARRSARSAGGAGSGSAAAAATAAAEPPLEALLRAYDDVLPRRGVAPAEDVHFYRILLRMSLDPAPGWWARWDREVARCAAAAAAAAAAAEGGDGGGGDGGDGGAAWGFVDEGERLASPLLMQLKQQRQRQRLQEQEERLQRGRQQQQQYDQQRPVRARSAALPAASPVADDDGGDGIVFSPWRSPVSSCHRCASADSGAAARRSFEAGGGGGEPFWSAAAAEAPLPPLRPVSASPRLLHRRRASPSPSPRAAAADGWVRCALGRHSPAFDAGVVAAARAVSPAPPEPPPPAPARAPPLVPPPLPRGPRALLAALLLPPGAAAEAEARALQEYRAFKRRLGLFGVWREHACAAQAVA